MADFIEQLNFLANRLDWRTGVDIAMIALGVMLLYRTVRTSGSQQILIGILIAVASLYAAKLLELSAIPWIFSNFTDVLIIFLIVVFQPELRRIFARAAAWRWRGLRSSRNNVVTVACEAAYGVRAKQWGALFVFPGNESVDPWLSGGFPGDAKPTPALILSIFDPDSPGHDGALLFEHGRIARFGSRLPLSSSGRLAPTLGTRHHAAMGLSEEVDALVVTVSEESGNISIFRGGQRDVIKSREELEERIAGHLKGFGWRRPGGLLSWRGALELAGSLIFGLFIWGAIVFSEGRLEEVEVTVPLGTLGKPAGLEESLSNRGVRLMLSGPHDILRTLEDEQLVARLNLSRLAPGTHRVPINPGVLSLPDEVRLLKAEPAAISVKLTPTAMRSVRIRPRLQGELPEQFLLEDVEIQPAEIRVYSTDPGGAPAANEVFTSDLDLGQIAEQLSVRGQKATWNGEVPLNPPETLRSVATGTKWPAVKVTITARSLDVAEPPDPPDTETEDPGPNPNPNKEPTTEPGEDAKSDPKKNPAKEPSGESGKEPAKEPGKAPAKNPPGGQDPEKEPVKKNPEKALDREPIQRAGKS
ncbi:MAG: diadenylate cyclase [bacterium]|nr:diadenylate cyclase [bacterium]